MIGNTSAPGAQWAVAIVGAGPVGAFAANLLGQAGVSTVLLEKETTLHPLPRAVHIDHEMMRLFQGVELARPLAALMRESQGHLHIGADARVIRYLGTAGRPRPFGWASDYFFYQPELEAGLRSGLARWPCVELRLGAEVIDLMQDDQGVILSVVQDGRTSQLRVRRVIACDGSRSIVRRRLDIALQDLQFEEPWLVVDAEVDGPLRFPALTDVPSEARLQELSVMMCNPARPTTVVPGRGTHRRWEFMLVPADDAASIARPEHVAALIAPWVEGLAHRIVRAAVYRFHGLLARHWQRGRIFLAGDAAHQTPPFFGQGMCHGLRDVANLAWKLALVESGRAPVALLESYQQEREPHVRHVIAAAIEAGRYICMLDPQEAARRDIAIRARTAAGVEATAADLIPCVAAGVVAQRPHAGERFVQPWLRCGGNSVLLDDFTGGGWRLFTTDGAAFAALRLRTPAAVAALDPSFIDISSLDDGGALAAWLVARDAWAVLVRPDHYVFGTASDALDVERLFNELAPHLAAG